MIDLTIDTDRLVAELHELAAFSSCPRPAPAVTRVVFSDEDQRARAWLNGKFDEAGLAVRADAMGNTFARWCPAGCDADAAAVGSGSHLDALPHAGMYDGTVGVIGALEAVRALQRAGHRPKRPVDVVLFTSEEPTRFGLGCTGSRALAGLLPPEDLAALTDDAGDSFDDVRQRAGFKGDLASVRLPDDAFAAFIELHIEQGPKLEAEGLDLGRVFAIAAPATVDFRVTGRGGHAGGVLMPDRHDALCAAAEMIHAIEQLARSSPSPDCVATVGTLAIHPGAVNSIPSRVGFSLDLRDTDPGNRDAVLGAIVDENQRIAQRRHVAVDHTVINADTPADCDAALVEALGVAADAGGYTHRGMISRAYHDSLFLAPRFPTAMLFIPCRGGVSHIPEEYAEPRHLEAGAATLARTLAALSA